MTAVALAGSERVSAAWSHVDQSAWWIERSAILVRVGTPDPLVPRMLGRYALYEKIASGGMASVHIGRLLGPVGFARTVAIKRMHPQFAEDPEFVSMFLDEARLAARIRHPNVVQTLDIVAMSGELFLVMDFVQGESLSRLIRAAGARGERIPPEMVTSVMVGVLHGLHAAHEARSDRGEPLDIVHRDVSPHNILVGTDGVARVLDFGVAKAIGRIQTTREGQLKGKLAYMAPEQVRGTAACTTDVYAASVVLWEALTGKRLFQGSNDAQVLDQLLRGCDVPPSRHAPDLPPSLDNVTMRGLNIDPSQRFPTAREMARALEDAIALAPASRVGDWVEAAARDTLTERSARIACIESDSSVQSLPPEPPSGSSLPRHPSQPTIASPPRRAKPAGEPLQPSVPTSVSATDTIPTQLSSSSSAGRASLLGARSRTVWLVAAAFAVLLVGALVFTQLRATPAIGAANDSASRTSTPLSPASVAGVAASASVAATQPPAESASSTATAVTALPSQSSPAATATRRAPATRHTGAPTAAPTAPPSRCNPPWYIDSRGVRAFRPECL